MVLMMNRHNNIPKVIEMAIQALRKQGIIQAKDELLVHWNQELVLPKEVKPQG
jgi:hypothetical protein